MARAPRGLKNGKNRNKCGIMPFLAWWWAKNAEQETAFPFRDKCGRHDSKNASWTNLGPENVRIRVSNLSNSEKQNYSTNWRSVRIFWINFWLKFESKLFVTAFFQRTKSGKCDKWPQIPQGPLSSLKHEKWLFQRRGSFPSAWLSNLGSIMAFCKKNVKKAFLDQKTHQKTNKNKNSEIWKPFDGQIWAGVQTAVRQCHRRSSGTLLCLLDALMKFGDNAAGLWGVLKWQLANLAAR